MIADEGDLRLPDHGAPREFLRIGEDAREFLVIDARDGRRKQNHEHDTDADDGAVDAAPPRPIIQRARADPERQQSHRGFGARHHQKAQSRDQQNPVGPAFVADRVVEKRHRRQRTNGAGDVLVEIEPPPVADDAGIGFIRQVNGLRHDGDREPVHDQHQGQHQAQHAEGAVRTQRIDAQHHRHHDDDFEAHAANGDHGRRFGPKRAEAAPEKQQRQNGRHRIDGAPAFALDRDDEDDREKQEIKNLAHQIALAGGEHVAVHQHIGIADGERLQADKDQQQKSAEGEFEEAGGDILSRVGIANGYSVIGHELRNTLRKSVRPSPPACRRPGRVCAAAGRGDSD